MENVIGLKNIEIETSFSSISDVSKLSNCLNLQKITLKDCAITNFPDLSPKYDKDENLISGCPNLTELYLDNNTLNGTSVSNVANITSLKKLSLAKNGLTDIYPLSSLVNLTELNLENNLLEEICYDKDNNDYNVCTFLANMNYTKTGKTASTGLSRLYLAGNKINDPDDNDDEFAPLKVI